MKIVVAVNEEGSFDSAWTSERRHAAVNSLIRSAAFYLHRRTGAMLTIPDPTCQPTTVSSGRGPKPMADQGVYSLASIPMSSVRRLTERWSTASWCRKARFSAISAAGPARKPRTSNHAA